MLQYFVFMQALIAITVTLHSSDDKPCASNHKHHHSLTTESTHNTSQETYIYEKNKKRLSIDFKVN